MHLQRGCRSESIDIAEDCFLFPLQNGTQACDRKKDHCKNFISRKVQDPRDYYTSPIYFDELLAITCPSEFLQVMAWRVYTQCVYACKMARNAFYMGSSGPIRREKKYFKSTNTDYAKRSTSSTKIMDWTTQQANRATSGISASLAPTETVRPQKHPDDHQSQRDQHELLSHKNSFISQKFNLPNRQSWYHGIQIKAKMMFIFRLHSIGQYFNILKYIFKCIAGTFYFFCINLYKMYIVLLKKPVYSFMIKSALDVVNYNRSYKLNNNGLGWLWNVRKFKPEHFQQTVYTAATLPEHHNPCLSMNKQQQLDAMSPQEFIPYILTKLTIDERESLLVDESQRRKTFLVNWPHDKNLSGIKMAQAGFYSFGEGDRVQCVFCRGSLHRWEADDIALDEHKRSFPFCRFVKGFDCGNRQYHSKNLEAGDMKNITSYEVQQQGNQEYTLDSLALDISTNRAAVPQKAIVASRLQTYRNWPKKISIKPEDLVNAGFFFTGSGDHVRCFFCSGGLKNWEEKDDPWIEHARWFPECLYLKQNKGQEFIEQVILSTSDGKKSAAVTEMQRRVKRLEQKKVIDIHEEMQKLAERLGHPKELVNKALEINGKPFDDVKDLVNIIHDLDNEEPALLTLQEPKPTLGAAATSVQGNSDRDTTEVDGAHGIAFNGGDSIMLEGRHKASCWNCALNKNKLTPANHIGMSCGHLIFCSQCNEEQQRLSLTFPERKILCPYRKCGVKLSACMRTYFG